ncbi:EboA domain-containing protein [Leptospira sp. 2 VSF19]|uniref:EboA domain-containing protein n=1 Tax=Leptospira soteropolitanensis TaxID=2950025 RepID=A0AAW5VNJ6_9LEPT|nr:EboA domain-containing protein [Leptospira soteropolitanensis]MCW7493604.1 EboA domain-containing protein [Leptospira soteropolitanensis]MCW7501203.1 EboA domain-containing protein [Leptospira soteropolitanensis]MCW7523611.1 EboA domain-containing protein [Leptospira soteropolitanensis]MCW7527316.1 EboA domain-containing protein [Leptospira soteropolitanensis]MCW7531173.1 EboA domain-containing protein [Leptospira soteropolitanensis]
MADIPANLTQFLFEQTTEKEREWLEKQSQSDVLDLMTAFVAAPRYLSKKIISYDSKSKGSLVPDCSGFQVNGWNLVRLARVWFLLHLSSEPKEKFVKNIETLFDTAELNELVALYSALPLLPYPWEWLPRATDAVRSNMGFVFDSIALSNPYPELYFSELAWNQLVLKTIFNGKPIDWIYGIDRRKNKDLALAIFDFISERSAAGRKVPLKIWRLVAPFADETTGPKLLDLLDSERKEERETAALVCFESKNPYVHNLLSKYPDLELSIKNGELDWSNIEPIPESNFYVPKS